MRDVLDDRSSAQIECALQFSRVDGKRHRSLSLGGYRASSEGVKWKVRNAVVVELTVYLKSRLMSAEDDSWQVAPVVA